MNISAFFRAIGLLLGPQRYVLTENVVFEKLLNSFDISVFDFYGDIQSLSSDAAK